jgi:hypothetical protein
MIDPSSFIKYQCRIPLRYSNGRGPSLPLAVASDLDTANTRRSKNQLAWDGLEGMIGKCLSYVS